MLLTSLHFTLGSPLPFGGSEITVILFHSNSVRFGAAIALSHLALALVITIYCFAQRRAPAKPP